MNDHPNQAFFIAAQAGVTPLAVGIPGGAKSAIIHAFARAAGRQCYTLIGSLREPADIMGYPYPVKEESGITSMHMTPPKWVSDCVAGGKWVLFFDELTCCPPAVQAAMLRVIAEKVVGDAELPDDVWMVAAANPPGVAANGYELESPMANRIVHLRWKLDWSAWSSGLMSGLDFPEPKFPILPDNWRENLPGVGSLIAAFRSKRPELFEPAQDSEGNIQMDRAKMGAAWPSPRSWTNAALCLAAAKSVRAGENVEYELTEGCVGMAAAGQFEEWRRNLDLPDPEELIEEFMAAEKKGREPKYTHPNRPDKVIALLGGVSQCVIQRNTPERWMAGMQILEHATRFEMDVAISCAKPLAMNIPNKGKGMKMDAAFVNRLFPVIKKVLVN